MREFDAEHLESGPARKAREKAGRETTTAEAARAAVDGRAGILPAASVLHLQRAAGNAGVAALYGEEQESPVKGVIGKGAGQPLDAPVRERMESSFGADFSDVRVHAGSSAAASAQGIDAHAYTVGNEIVLGDGHGPGSPAHERTLAHELTHVVQQRSGPVDGTPAPGGISVSSPSDRFERAAEATAEAVTTTGRAPQAAAGTANAAVQRQAPDEEEVQELAVQRDRGDGDEEVQELAVQRDGR